MVHRRGGRRWGNAAAGVGIDDVEGVVALEQGEVVPEEEFGGNLRFEIGGKR